MATNIPTGIIDALTHPPLAALKRSTTFPTQLFNPYSGSGSQAATRYAFGNPLLPIASAYGFRWSVNTAPPEAGRRSGAVLEYENAFFSFALHYILFDGTDFIADQVRTGLASGFWMFNIQLPTALEYFIDPGWTLHLDWLVAYNQGSP